MSQRYSLLWVDMKVSRQGPEIETNFNRFFDIHAHSPMSSLDAAIERVRPSVICFDFDFPSKPGLKTLVQTKHDHSCIPILMLTVQHSEALAVWAFRSRVWDYLVKPISTHDLERCFSGISNMLELHATQPERRTPAFVRSLIPEENRASGSRSSAPLTLSPAIEYVERCYRGKISSSKAAELCGLTTFQLSRLFKETYNLTFQDYVLRFRVREACRLLRNPEAEVAEIAHVTGFNDPSYFSRIFRRYMQCSPSEFHARGLLALEPDLLTLGTAGDTPRLNA